jgi:hypothetical protein
MVRSTRRPAFRERRFTARPSRPILACVGATSSATGPGTAPVEPPVMRVGGLKFRDTKF